MKKERFAGGASLRDLRTAALEARAKVGIGRRLASESLPFFDLGTLNRVVGEGQDDPTLILP
jgi:hypothetical protein